MDLPSSLKEPVQMCAFAYCCSLILAYLEVAETGKSGSLVAIRLHELAHFFGLTAMYSVFTEIEVMCLQLGRGGRISVANATDLSVRLSRIARVEATEVTQNVAPSLRECEVRSARSGG